MKKFIKVFFFKFNYQIERVSTFHFSFKKVSIQDKDYYKYFLLHLKKNFKALIKKYSYCHLFEFENFQRLLDHQSKKIFKSLKNYSEKKKKLA